MSDPTDSRTTKIQAWAEQNSTTNGYGSREYSPFVCHIMNLFDPRALRRKCECAWIPPYGFVIEAGCSEHD